MPVQRRLSVSPREMESQEMTIQDDPQVSITPTRRNSTTDDLMLAPPPRASMQRQILMKVTDEEQRVHINNGRYRRKNSNQFPQLEPQDAKRHNDQ